jgi:cell wall-associated NlpC family hydrolase
VGITVPRTSETQWAQLSPLAKGQSIQPGDLLFFGTPDDASHVGMAIGNGQMIHAPYTGANVQIASVSRTDYLGAARPAP